MKALVVFYSRTGNTRKIGKEIANRLKADIDEIIDKKRRYGILGWLGSGKDALRKKLTEITYQKKPENYGIVIIGTPVWAGTLTPAVRTYMTQNKFKKVAFFCTCGSSSGKVFEEMKKLSKTPVATLKLKNKEKVSKRKIEDFCKKLMKY